MAEPANKVARARNFILFLFVCDPTEDKRTVRPDRRPIPSDAGAGRRQILRHHVRKVRLPQFQVSFCPSHFLLIKSTALRCQNGTQSERRFVYK